MSRSYVLAGILVMSAVTVLLRVLPFLIFGEKRKIPEFLHYLGRVLPFAIIGMLVVYGLKDTDFLGAGHGIPEALGVLTVVLLHLWKKNTLLSISVGTVFYMLLVQLVF